MPVYCFVSLKSEKIQSSEIHLAPRPSDHGIILKYKLGGWHILENIMPKMRQSYTCYVHHEVSVC